MKEKWVDIKGYEGLYQISNLGNLKTLERDYINNFGYKVHVKEKLMSYSVRSGYYVVVLHKNGARKSKQIHRLVAQHFLNNPENKPIVNHKDFNIKNNLVSNLEWCTQRENVAWSICNMRKRRIVTTREMYGISLKNKKHKYEVTIDRKYYGNFSNLEDAKKKRDEVLNELNITI